MNTFIDTGPLTALINKKDKWHAWTSDRVKEIKPPFITCEAVLSECCFLLMRSDIDIRHLFNFIRRGDIHIESAFIESGDQTRVIEIMNKYQNLPASFADASLVRIAEIAGNSQIFTLDTDFSIYRTTQGEPLSLIMPGV